MKTNFEQDLKSSSAGEPNGFVRRVRVLPSKDGTRLGMDQATAMELINASAVPEHLAEAGHGMLMVPEAELTEDAYSPVQIEIQPPLPDEQLRKLARLSVEGTLVDSWSPQRLNVPYEGVEWTDFRHGGLPDSEFDRGFSHERLASSLEYVSSRALAEANLLAS